MAAMQANIAASRKLTVHFLRFGGGSGVQADGQLQSSGVTKQTQSELMSLGLVATS